MKTPILGAEHRWECPNCPQTALTHEIQPHTRFHRCTGLKGLEAPFVPAGTDCKVEAVEREDYVRGAIVTTDKEGRPVAGVKTTRADGSNDVAAFAECAQAKNEVL